MSIEIKSNAFETGKPIPRKFTGDGENISPPLMIENLPPQVKELALIVDDPDAPRTQPFVHWVMYKIPASASMIPDDVPRLEMLKEPAGAMQGINSKNQVGYVGPTPPPGHGVHHYHFQLFALDKPLDLEPGLDKEQLLAAMSGHILDQVDLVGTYER